MALNSLVAFKCLPQTRELLGLLVSNCHRTMAGYVLVLEPTKGGQRRLLQDSLSAQKFPGEFLVGLSDATFLVPHGSTFPAISCLALLQPPPWRCNMVFQNDRLVRSNHVEELRGRWQHLKIFQKPKWLWLHFPFHWPSNVAHAPVTTLSSQTVSVGPARCAWKDTFVHEGLVAIGQHGAWLGQKPGVASRLGGLFQTWRCASCQSL